MQKKKKKTVKKMMETGNKNIKWMGEKNNK